MTEPRLNHVQCLDARGLHRMAYWEWGDAANPRVLVCAHGVSRQGRDFDVLAQAMSDRYRVVCPDLPGRGRSDWLADPSDYALPQYASDMITVLARTQAAEIDWIGSSLGGLTGIHVAALAGSPIRRMVVNDIGPYLPWSGLARIGSYVSSAPTDFESIAAAESFLREVLAPFGDLTDEHWAHLTRHSVARDPASGRYAMLCDPQIVRAFRNPWHYSLDLWKYWTAIKLPTLVIRGVDSDLLTADLAEKMERRSLFAKIHEIEGCGHAPPLMNADQIKLIADFLASKTPFP